MRENPLKTIGTMRKAFQRTTTVGFLVLAVGVWAVRPTLSTEVFTGKELRVCYPKEIHRSQVLPQPLVVPSGMAYRFDAWIDPVKRSGGNFEVAPGFSFGLPTADTNAIPYGDTSPKIAISVREQGDRGFWSLFIDGVDISANPADRGNHDNKEYQKPNVFAYRDGPYHVRIVCIPEDGRTRLRLYFEDMFRPAEEHLIPRWVEPQYAGYYGTIGGKRVATETVVFEKVTFCTLSREEALRVPSSAEAVLAALDLEQNALAEVRRLMGQGDAVGAQAVFDRYMRRRTTPPGAPLDSAFLYGANYREIANEALQGRYGTKGFFAEFSDQFVDPDGSIHWERDNGYLNRHFHWCSLAKTYSKTKDGRYAQRFADEVTSWVRNEPFLQPRHPGVSGVDCIDGTVFKLGWMNTSNIGRRCELTWWPAYEIFRNTSEFTDEAHFDMLLGFLRHARLLTNPTSFAWWDDGGAHGTMALLQTALMLPEFKESARWKQLGEERLSIVIARQFYPDGAHVSLSTGYNFASIKALENAVKLYRRFGLEPDSIFEPLERAYRHPMLLARPNRGQIDLNDGGWGAVDDHLRLGSELFPDNDMLRWFATSGAEGTPTVHGSVYFPNAGHFVMRTGWGKEHRYLFMDAGPVGASHGKEDKLAITLDIGGNLLLTNGGRAAYSDPIGLRYTGSIYAQNAVVVDDLNHARIPFRAEIYGWEPEPRRWLTSDAFDYAEGFHTHGWWGSTENVQGKHTRQVVCIKGPRPPTTTCYAVFDTLEFEDDSEHVCEALWHFARNETEILPDGLSIESWDSGGALRIIPLVTDGLDARLVIGQTEPHWQGWTVYGDRKKPVPTAIHRWRVKERSTMGWLLVPTTMRGKWCVAGVERSHNVSSTDTVSVVVVRNDGGRDYILRRQPGDNLPIRSVGPRQTEQDVAVVCISPEGQVQAELIERLDSS